MANFCLAPWPGYGLVMVCTNVAAELILCCQFALAVLAACLVRLQPSVPILCQPGNLDSRAVQSLCTSTTHHYTPGTAHILTAQNGARESLGLLQGRQHHRSNRTYCSSQTYNRHALCTEQPVTNTEPTGPTDDARQCTWLTLWPPRLTVSKRCNHREPGLMRQLLVVLQNYHLLS
jgi:hypothetical protein